MKRPPKRSLSVDGFVRRDTPPPEIRKQPAPKPMVIGKKKPNPSISSAAAPPARTVLAPRPAQRKYAPQLPNEAVPSFWQRLQLPLCVSLGLLFGFFMQSALFGITVIAVYAVVALVAHIRSQVTFVMAFLSLICVALLLVVRHNAEAAGNFATYTFLLLLIAVASLTIESRRSTKPVYKKRKRR